MKRLIFGLVALVMGLLSMSAQDYNIQMAGLSTNGGYVVKVTTILDKKQYKSANDYLKRMAIDGVMFRGVSPGSGYGSQRPLIDDSDTATLKAEFFEAFNREGQYVNFCTLEPTTVVVTELPKKKYEVTGTLTIDKERLIRYLTEHSIISNFDSLW